ncbi:hypothetical protein ACQJBY_005294 [Aegilops geniculata]
MDAFSAAPVTPLPELAALLAACNVNARYELLQPITRVVVSPAASVELEFRLVAVMIRTGKFLLSTCRPAGEPNTCVALDHYFEFSIADIRFFQGKIYALSKINETLRALDLNNGYLDELPASASCIEVICGVRSEFAMTEEPHLQKDPWPYGHVVAGRYLVECNGKLLMVRRWARKPLISFSYYSMTEFRDKDGYDLERTRRFEVFEVDLGRRMSHGRWKKVHGLDGWAMFVSSRCSKAVTAASHGAREDCVYFAHQWGRRDPDNPIGGSGVYNMRDGAITRPLLPEPAAVAGSLPWSRRFPAWVFPMEV